VLSTPAQLNRAQLNRGTTLPDVIGVENAER